MIAEHNPLYGAYVQAERDRLGEAHPMFKTQYLLETIASEGRLFSPAQLAQMRGDHARRHSPREGRLYVAGVDIAGEDEAGVDQALRAAKPRKDSTVVTIAEIQRTEVAPGISANAARVVEHLYWTGRKHADQLAQLVDVLRNVWGCQRVVVDATGIGQAVASFLVTALGGAVVEAFTFTAPAKSELGYQLLAAVNAGNFKVYSEPEQSEEAGEWWYEAEHARYEVRAQNRINFFVDEAEGHDDFVLSAALCARAAANLTAAPVSAVVQRQTDYDDGRY